MGNEWLRRLFGRRPVERQIPDSTTPWSLRPARSIPGMFHFQGSLLIFLDVYQVELPDLYLSTNVTQGLLRGDGISYCRVDYEDAHTALYIVTSTLPPGRSATEDFAAQLDRERDTEARVGRVAPEEHYRARIQQSVWGDLIYTRLVNVDVGSFEEPFPVYRRLLAIEANALHSMSCHWMFANGGNRFEVAVYGRPRSSAGEGESMPQLEQRLNNMGERAVASLQARTVRR